MERADSQPPPWLRKATIEIAVAVLAIVAALWVVYRLRSLLFVLLIGFFISIALEPAVQFLTKRGWGRHRSSMVVFLAAFSLSSLFVIALIPLFVSQGSAIVQNLPGYIESISNLASERGWIDVEIIDAEVEAQLRNTSALLSRYGGSVANALLAVGNSVLGAVFNLVTIALFAYYALAEAPQLREAVLRFLPPRRQTEILRMYEIAVSKTGGYIYSRLILAIISAIVTGIVLSILGVPFAAALGMWVGILSQFVPVVGAYIAAVLPVIVALVADPWDALWVLVLLVAYQQVENFVIAPRITARAMAIHPAVAVGSVLAGAALFGGIGAVLALPVAATIQAFVATAIERYELVSSPLLPSTLDRDAP